MAESTVIVTGRDELLRGVNTLPDRVTAALKAVARATATRVWADAKDRLLNPSPPVKQPSGGSGASLAEAMTIVEDAANRQFVIVSGPPRGRPANVPLWWSYGTVRQPARPYLAPAAKAAETRYEREMEAAAVAAVAGALG